MKLSLPGPVKSFGFVGERRAVALLCLGFYSTLLFFIAVASRQEIPEWTPVFVGLLAVYVTAFFALAADWFWGRWFGIGIGYWGLTMAGMGFVTQRTLPPPMIIFGVMHGLIAVCLMGEKMASAYDAKPAWRARYSLDEQGALRVRRAVTRAASSLPALIMFALAPREQAGVVVTSVAILAGIGLGGLLSGRSYGVLLLGGAGVASAAAVIFFPALSAVDLGIFGTGPTGHGLTALLSLKQFSGAFAAAVLFTSVTPFAAAVFAFLRPHPART